MSDGTWTRGDRLALIGLSVSVMGTVAAWAAVPGFREALGLGAPPEQAAPAAAATSAPDGVDPPPPARSTATAAAQPAAPAPTAESDAARSAAPTVTAAPPTRPPACTSFEACLASCDAGAAVSCTSTADMLRGGTDGAAKDDARAHELYSRACEGGEPSGCAGRGWLELNGEGTPKNAAAALASFSRACNDTTAAGCFGMGVLLRGGFGITADRTRAVDAFRRACESGTSPAACKAKDQLEKK